MPNPLYKLLDSLKLKFEDLTAEERRTYQRWSEQLTAPEVSIDELKAFLPKELEHLEQQAADYTNSQQKDLYLKAAIRNLQMIQAFISGPEAKKQWLAKYLESRL